LPERSSISIIICIMWRHEPYIVEKGICMKAAAGVAISSMTFFAAPHLQLPLSIAAAIPT
jgi:hypothetical protein